MSVLTFLMELRRHLMGALSSVNKIIEEEKENENKKKE